MVGRIFKGITFSIAPMGKIARLLPFIEVVKTFSFLGNNFDRKVLDREYLLKPGAIHPINTLFGTFGITVMDS